ncbi:nucleoside-diphosphate kinase [Candidatus Campbellbacteria bacterium]|nr:nucleoside-diphosphate kinase [Candidatus Campbellbacteria bacterium]|tara:strand:+ start:6047 stop:6652 length:606 start_codon:yes stop_codon:yes gene_type:complete
MTSRIKEQSLVLIKPDGVQRSLVGDIVARFEQRGLKIIGIKFLVPSEEQCRKHYNKDENWFLEKGQEIVNEMKKDNLEITREPIEYGKDIIRNIIQYMTGGPVVALALEGHAASEIVGQMVGSTEPKNADIGTIRGDFTIDSYYLSTTQKRAVRNLIHASENGKEAQREISIWFHNDELIDYSTAHERILYDVSADGHWES